MKKRYGFCGALLLCIHLCANAQINFTANDFSHAPSYNGYFWYGTNGGWYGSSWDDKSLADIAAGNSSKNVKGVGSKTFRPALPEDFVLPWSYDIRLSEYQHYASLGVKDNTVMLGSPFVGTIGGQLIDHRDSITYPGCSERSRMFRRLYEPIWDGGANGTPVNDSNYYAAYVYQIVTRYKNWVKFWEIMNEPDYDESAQGYKNKGETGNWFDNDPDPCALTNMRAPVYVYVRMLRVSYEVIKSIDPTAQVATGGLGFASFLDAILRHTDNPVDGSVTAQYPLGGGAYFDVLSYHSYPMFNLSAWSDAISGFIHHRHSDAAITQFVNLKNSFNTVLESYGYNGSAYPRKLFICTENNIPRKSITNYIGSDEAQKNYVIKALVESQRIGLEQYYIFKLGDDKSMSDGTANWFSSMGLYQNLTDIGPKSNGGAYRQQYANSGIAYKTTSDILMYSRYDAARTAEMNLPANIGGAAFTDSIGSRVYVLWAKTITDLSEATVGVYSFPLAMNVSPTLSKREWDFSVTNTTSSMPSVNIPLTGTPIFLSENFVPLPLDDDLRPRDRDDEETFAVSLYPNPASDVASLKFTLESPAQVTVRIYNTEGKWITTSISSKTFGSGTHSLTLREINKLAAGVYYCSFETEKIRIIRKLVVTHL